MEYKIPTWHYKNGWSYTEFESRESFRDFLVPLFKEPGLYNFDIETSREFVKEARVFKEKRIYCEHSPHSQAYKDYWDTEKEKCRKGAIYHSHTGETFYLPRFFYHWLNFLQIYDKRKKVKGAAFPEFRDVQYHMSLYECLAELHDKNGITLKRRQVASTYLHDAMLFNRYIFEEQFKGKMGASDKKYIEGANGAWRFLSDYLNFTNSHTAWIRYNDPDKVGTWIQRTKASVTTDGEKEERYVGTFSSISAVTFDKDPASGVGGAIDLFYYEEAGIAPTADTTYGYIREAQKEGSEITGYFTMAGSVGSLDQCEPMKKFIEDPISNDFYPVKSRLKKDTGEEVITGLFIPIHWGYVPYIDEAGNSLVKEAKEYIDNFYAEERKKKTPAEYQLLISQGPRTIDEAFATRTQSIFPLKYTAKQVQKIEDKEYWLKNCTLERNPEGKVTLQPTDREPNVYPVDKNKEDKRGCVVIHEMPIENTPWFTYFGSVDPVEVGRTVSSDSLACIYIWKNAIEKHKIDESGESEIFVERGKLVAEWVGRYDDPNETNEMMSMLIEFYNAWTISENNKNSFINYMRINKRQKYLAKKSDMLFDKEMRVVQNDFQEYGWTKGTAIWEKILEYGVDSLSELLYNEQGQDGTIYKSHLGHERIPFIWLLKEMQAYNDKGNFDRIVSYCSLMAFVKIQQAIRGIKRVTERSGNNDDFNKQMADLLYKKSPFHHIGRNGLPGFTKNQAYNNIRRSPFKNMR